MFLLSIFLGLIAIGLLFIYKIGKRGVVEKLQKTDYFSKYDIGWVFIWIGVVFFCVSTIINYANYSTQLGAYEDARTFKQEIRILEVRKDTLTKEFTKHLATEYPAIEKEIFGKLKPGENFNMNIVLNYPEIKSSKTLIKLVDEIKEISDNMYNKQLEAQKLYKEIRYRKVNPWILLKPRVPEDIHDAVYQK
jgi:hypothetical protein